jgi:hypothetical protein
MSADHFIMRASNSFLSRSARTRKNIAPTMTSRSTIWLFAKLRPPSSKYYLENHRNFVKQQTHSPAAMFHESSPDLLNVHLSLNRCVWVLFPRSAHIWSEAGFPGGFCRYMLLFRAFGLWDSTANTSPQHSPFYLIPDADIITRHCGYSAWNEERSI